MKFELKITDERGKEYNFNINTSPIGEPKNLNNFILDALSISESKRELPLLIQTPNGSEVYPSLKMRFKDNGSAILGDEIESMVVSWDR